MHQVDVNRLDVAFCEHLRRVVGPPSNLEWDAPLHEILHEWNVRAMGYWGIKAVHDGRKIVGSKYWKLALQAQACMNIGVELFFALEGLA